MAGLAIFLLISVAFAKTSSNAVPPSRLALHVQWVNANDLKPAPCAALNLTGILTGNGSIKGTNQADLILGSPGGDAIEGRNGDDCIIGGDGDDDIDGGPGTDVCIGGGGNDTFKRCEAEFN